MTNKTKNGRRVRTREGRLALNQLGAVDRAISRLMQRSNTMAGSTLRQQVDLSVLDEDKCTMGIGDEVTGVPLHEEQGL